MQTLHPLTRDIHLQFRCEVDLQPQLLVKIMEPSDIFRTIEKTEIKMGRMNCSSTTLITGSFPVIENYPISEVLVKFPPQSIFIAPLGFHSHISTTLVATIIRISFFLGVTKYWSSFLLFFLQ